MANFLLVASTAMQFAALYSQGSGWAWGSAEAALAVSAFAVGLFALGPVSAWLVDRYRRKSVYFAALILMAAVAFLPEGMPGLTATALTRFASGALCGLAQVALGSTILNDISRSDKRTRSDYDYAWSALLAIPAGVAASMLLIPQVGMRGVAICQAALLLASCWVVAGIRVPFRAPMRLAVFSRDRFWQPGDFPAFAGLMLLSAAFGAFVSQCGEAEGYLFVALGVAAAFPLRVMVFANADVRAEIVTGMLLVVAALLVPVASKAQASLHAAALMMGAGIALSSARYLLYFLKLTGHCQRGTAQTTYMLSRQTGYAAGFALAACLPGAEAAIPLAATGIALALYLALIHPWFKKHSDRDFKFREV